MAMQRGGRCFGSGRSLARVCCHCVLSAGGRGAHGAPAQRGLLRCAGVHHERAGALHRLWAGARRRSSQPGSLLLFTGLLLTNVCPPAASCSWLRLSPSPHPDCLFGVVQAEQMIVDAVRNGDFQARFDHKNNTVHFGGQVRLPAACRGPALHCCCA